MKNRISYRKSPLFVYLVLFFTGLAGNSHAIDIFVKPNVVPGTVPNTYATLVSALAACNNGDRVFIQPGSYTTQDLTLNKSILFCPDSNGATVTLTGGLNIHGFANMKLQVLGIECPFITAHGGNGTMRDTSRASVYLIDNKVTGNVSFDVDYYDLTCARMSIVGTTTMRYGNFVVSTTDRLNINSEPGGGSNDDTVNKILIVADTINQLHWRSTRHKMVICNNKLDRLALYAWNHFNGNTNKILNNEFSKLFIPTVGVPYYNFDISNNIISNFGVPNLVYIGGDVCGGGCDRNTFALLPFNSNREALFNGNAEVYTRGVCNGPSWDCCRSQGQVACSYNISWNPNAEFPNKDVSGIFRWTYNGFTIAGSGGSGTLNFINIAGTTDTLNAGNPAGEYYDIDLTVNDRGRRGGAYSIDNYNPAINSNGSKAFIFDLDIPTILNPSNQSVRIRAKGYHRN